MPNKKNKNLEELAYIQMIATDQGTGGSYCSSCQNDLDVYVDKMSVVIMDKLKYWIDCQKNGLLYDEKKYNTELRCPSCNKKLQFGSIWVNSGGSDF